MSQQDSAETPSASSDEGESLWHVHFGGEEIRLLSLDQLDDAFRSGSIDGQTAVWTEGMEGWCQLAEVADLDEDSDDGEDDEPLTVQTERAGDSALEAPVSEDACVSTRITPLLPPGPTAAEPLPFAPVLPPLAALAPLSAEGPFPPQLPNLLEFDGCPDETTSMTATASEEYPPSSIGAAPNGPLRGWLVAAAGLAAIAVVGLLVSRGDASTPEMAPTPTATVSAASTPLAALQPLDPAPEPTGMRAGAETARRAVAGERGQGARPIGELLVEGKAQLAESETETDSSARLAAQEQADEEATDRASARSKRRSRARRAGARKRATARRAKARAKRRRAAAAKRRASARKRRRARPAAAGSASDSDAVRFDPLNESLP